MKVNLLQRIFHVAILTCILAACNDDKYDGPSPDEVNATYSNLLSAGENANLTLLYNGDVLIGKKVYFKLKDAHTGYLSLKQILPGEQESNLDNISLTTDGESYSFSGTTTTSAGTSLTYAGNVEAGSLTLSLSDISLTSNLLKEKQLSLVKFGNVEYQYGERTVSVYHSALMMRMHLKTPLGSDQTMLSAFFPIIGALATQIGGCSLNIVLNNIQFGADGNITADYAGWPEGLGVMEVATYPSRSDEEYTTSPANLATYYFADDETMYVVPNIDQIIYTVQQNMAKANRSSLLDTEMQEFLEKLYTQLATWARYGIKFKAMENPYTGEGYAPVYTFDNDGNRIVNTASAEQYEGDYLLQIDTDQLAIVGVIIDALPYLAPDLCETPLSEVSALENYASLLPLIFPGVETVGDLLASLKTLGDNIDFEIGLLLNSPVN